MHVKFFISCCAALNGLIYCIGGCCEQNVLGECERYNPELDEWTSIAPLRTARFQVIFSHSQHYIFLIVTSVYTTDIKNPLAGRLYFMA